MVFSAVFSIKFGPIFFGEEVVFCHGAAQIELARR